jgi:hypothetical protein
MEILSSTQTLIKTLTDGEEFSLDTLEDWDELSPMQQIYINSYVDSKMQVTIARARCGVRKSMLDEWMIEPIFSKVLEQVEDIFTEGLASVHYQDALTNSKIRAGVLRARGAKGYEDKKAPTQHNHLHLSGLTPQQLLEAVRGRLPT